MTNKVNMTDEQKLKAGRGIFNFRGVLVEQVIGGWRLLDKTVSTYEDVEETILNACSSLSESIPKDTGGVTVKDGFSCVNGSEINGNGANSLNNYERVSYSQTDENSFNGAKNRQNEDN